MPVSVYALIATFVAVSIVAGVAAARIVGPWRPWAPLVPATFAFGALYLVAHRWGESIGPQVRIWGWEVALPFDVAVAIGAALLGAVVQARVVRGLRRDEPGS
jgi:hypothetical protein